MRIVSGVARGRRLLTPQGREVRPTSDRVREATFNALVSMDAVAGSHVLDLFAGSGAMGIEALSRGADRATFVDASPAAISAVRENLAATGLSGRATVVRGDAWGSWPRPRPSSTWSSQIRRTPSTTGRACWVR